MTAEIENVATLCAVVVANHAGRLPAPALVGAVVAPVKLVYSIAVTSMAPCMSDLQGFDIKTGDSLNSFGAVLRLRLEHS